MSFLCHLNDILIECNTQETSDIHAIICHMSFVFMDFFIFVLFILFTTSSYGVRAGPVRADT